MSLLFRITAAVLLLGPVAAQAADPADPAAAAPQIFSPGVISGPANDADPAFAADGRSLVFSRNGVLMASSRSGEPWSKPEIAPFSGVWMDAQPTMAPDGSFLVFVSNRPLTEGGKAHPGGQLWRVDRQGAGWGQPWLLPSTVNQSANIWGPSIAGDGSLYFMDRVGGKGPFHIWRAQAKTGGWAAAQLVKLGSDPAWQEVDPAVAPDESFLVFSAKAPDDEHERLFIAFRSGSTWGSPVDLGDSVNGRKGGNDSNEGRLGPDGRTLYFSSDRTVPIHYPHTVQQAAQDLARIEAWDNGNQNVWSVSLEPWIAAARKSSGQN
ncbi:MAG TPA: hypothetical protein VGM81_05685 [Burkholderiaceae bacterium]|jgi:Tol biopolymer transport system component